MYKTDKFLITTIVVLVVISVVAQTSADYCAISKQHVGCNNKNSYGSACGTQHRILDMNSLKVDVLKAHNDYRNKIAMGDQPPYLPGVRIGVAQWDKELAKLAEMHVKNCLFKHDVHGTKKFPVSGQNLAKSCWYGMERTDKSVILEHIDMWYNEYKDADMSYINRFNNSNTGKAIGHFTAVVNERNNYVGCSAIQYKEDKNTCILTTCNYSYNNVMGRPIYVAGTSPGSSCKSRDPNFKNLCSTDEVYDYNL